LDAFHKRQISRLTCVRDAVSSFIKVIGWITTTETGCSGVESGTNEWRKGEEDDTNECFHIARERKKKLRKRPKVVSLRLNASTGVDVSGIKEQA
jgi:hypothetical protein